MCDVAEDSDMDLVSWDEARPQLAVSANEECNFARALIDANE